MSDYLKIAIIGAAGGMGESYAKAFAEKGHQVYASDVNYNGLRKLKHTNITNFRSAGKAMRDADLVIYSTPIAKTPGIIARTIRYAKPGSILGGFTSVKTSEVGALRKAKGSVNLVTFHPLHAPTPNLVGHTVAIVPIRANPDAIKTAKKVFAGLGIKTYSISAAKHDEAMADTQALTHFTLLSMALAWKMRNILPDESTHYSTNLDKLKADMALRILAMNPDVYAGIAMLNPRVPPQIKEYVKTLNEISAAIQTSDTKKLGTMWREATDFLGRRTISKARGELESVLKSKYNQAADSNSQISLLAMALAWKKLGIRPSKVKALQTPPYKVRSLLVHTAVSGNSNHYTENAFKSPNTLGQDDLAFIAAANTWMQVIEKGDLESYKRLFEKTREFFGPERIAGAKSRTDAIIRKMLHK